MTKPEEAARVILVDAITRIAQKACRNGESGDRNWPRLYTMPARESWRCVGETYADEVLAALGAAGVVADLLGTRDREKETP